MDITRIKYDGQTVAVSVRHQVGKSGAEMTITGEEPSGEFEDALSDLKAFVPKLCKPMLAEKKFVELGTVTGITISRKNEDAPGYVITAKCPVEGVNSPLNIATPILPRPQEDSGEFEYRADLFAAFDELEEEARKFLKRERPTWDLFAGENGRRPAPEPTPIEREAAEQAVRAAFVAALPRKPKGERWEDPAFVADNLALYIAEAWEDRATTFEGTEYAGFVRIGDVWCYLLSGPQPAFYHDIAAPTEFNAPDVDPDVSGEQLVAWAREAWGIETPVTA